MMIMFILIADWFVPPREGDEKVPLMPALQDHDEEVNEGKN